MVASAAAASSSESLPSSATKKENFPPMKKAKLSSIESDRFSICRYCEIPSNLLTNPKTNNSEADNGNSSDNNHHLAARIKIEANYYYEKKDSALRITISEWNSSGSGNYQSVVYKGIYSMEHLMDYILFKHLHFNTSSSNNNNCSKKPATTNFVDKDKSLKQLFVEKPEYFVNIMETAIVTESASITADPMKYTILFFFPTAAGFRSVAIDVPYKPW